MVFNKIDIQSHLFAINWMKSLDDFEAALRSNKTYMSTLIQSLGNVLDAFYANIKTVGVSSVTGQGMNDFFEQIEQCKVDYFQSYKPMLLRKRKEREQMEEMEKKKQMEKLEKDATNQQHKIVYKAPSKDEVLEKMMNLGLYEDDEQNEDNLEQQEDDEMVKCLHQN